MTSTTANEPRPTRGAPVWPVVLIVAGALLLLGNVGWLSWHVLFSLEHLFPPLLVAFGLDMLLQGRHRLPIVVGAIVAFAALSAGAGARLGTGGPAPEPMEVAQSLEGARRAVVALSSGVTDLTVRGDARSSLLVAGTVRPLRGERVQRSFDVAGGVARFALHSEGGFARWLGRASRPGGWDLTLGGGGPSPSRSTPASAPPTSTSRRPSSSGSTSTRASATRAWSSRRAAATRSTSTPASAPSR